MIIFDTETTGLPAPAATPLDKQPRIIEFGAIKYSDDDPTQELARMSFLCNPGSLPLPEIITKITGLTDADLKGQPRFPAFYGELCDFFLGERTLIAHNIAFDINLLRFDLSRMNKAYAFPWPPNQICTVDATMSIRRHRLKLNALYEMATGNPMVEAHRAILDVEALHVVVLWCIEQGHVVR